MVDQKNHQPYQCYIQANNKVATHEGKTEQNKNIAGSVLIQKLIESDIRLGK